MCQTIRNLNNKSIKNVITSLLSLLVTLDSLGVLAWQENSSLKKYLAIFIILNFMKLKNCDDYDIYVASEFCIQNMLERQ